MVAAPLDARVECVWTSACRFGWGLILTAVQLCFDRCVLNQLTDHYVWDLTDVWEPFPREDVVGRMGIWGKEGKDDENLWWHQASQLVIIVAHPHNLITVLCIKGNISI